MRNSARDSEMAQGFGDTVFFYRWRQKSIKEELFSFATFL
jgi:hypothetical protein